MGAEEIQRLFVHLSFPFLKVLDRGDKIKQVNPTTMVRVKYLLTNTVTQNGEEFVIR